MRALSNLIGILAIFAGIGLSLLAFAQTGIASSAVSAAQVTQVYSQANFYALESIAAFAFALVCVISARPISQTYQERNPLPPPPAAFNAPKPM